MTATAAAPASKGRNLVQPIVVGGLIVFAVRLLDYWVVYSLIFKYPMTILMQYIASGLLGLAAFEGGMGTVLLGTLFHLVISMVVSLVFFLAAQRLSFVRRNFIVSGMVYGLIVYVVMNMVVTPLSAAPPPDPLPMWVLPEGIITMILLAGLPLAFLAQRALSDE